MSLDWRALAFLLAARAFADILIAASPAIQNYDKVYEPVKDRVKQIPDKIKGMRGQNDQGDDYSDDDYYDQPKRHSSRRDSRRSRADDKWVEESYERKVSNRARSAGRDGPHGGGGRGLDRERRRKSAPAFDYAKLTVSFLQVESTTPIPNLLHHLPPKIVASRLVNKL